MIKKEKIKKLESIRPLGKITLELECLLSEMVDSHDLQWGEILGLVHTWLQIHAPEAREEYCSDNSSPIFYYGPRI